MKVVHLSTSDTGGAGIAAARLHKALLADGIDSRLLTMHRFRNDIPASSKYGSQNIFHRLVAKSKSALHHYNIIRRKDDRLRKKYLHGRIQGFEHFSFPYSEIDIGKDPFIRNADIIHLHWVSDGFIDYKKLFQTGKKFCWTLHDMNPFTGGCHHSDGCTKFTGDCTYCYELTGTRDKNISERILQYKMESLQMVNPQTIRIISPSFWLKKLSSESLLFKKFNHHVIRNAFDISEIYPEDKKNTRKELNLPLDKKIILFNAHHISNNRKGIMILLESISLLNDDNIFLCGVGHTGKYGDEKIKSLGYLNDPVQIRKSYSAADVFVLPSIAENFPNTLCESLLCGVPVVAFDVGGNSEIIKEGNGRLAGRPDAAALAENIKSVLYADYFDRDKISVDAASQYSSDLISEKYIEIYKSLLQ